MNSQVFIVKCQLLYHFLSVTVSSCDSGLVSGSRFKVLSLALPIGVCKTRKSVLPRREGRSVYTTLASHFAVH